MNKPIEDWMLTAYVFGDLDDDQVQAVETAISNDPGLQTEIDEIRATLTTVGKALHDKEPYLISADQLSAMRTSIASAIQQEGISIPPIQHVRSAKDSGAHRQAWWFGLSALAASGLAALVFGPGLLSSRDKISFSPEPERVSKLDALAKSQRGADADGLVRTNEQLATESNAPARGFDAKNVDSYGTQLQLKESEQLGRSEYFATDFNEKSETKDRALSVEFSKETKAGLGVSATDAPVIESNFQAQSQQQGTLARQESDGARDSAEVALEDALEPGLLGTRVESTGDNKRRHVADNLFDNSQSMSQAPAAAPIAGGGGFAGGSYGGAGGGGALYNGQGGAAYGGGYAGGGPSGPAGVSGGAGNYGAGYGDASYGGGPGGYSGAAPASQPGSSAQANFQSDAEVSMSGDESTRGIGESHFRYQTPIESKQEVAATGPGASYGGGYAGYERRIPTTNLWMAQPEVAQGDRFEAIQENDFKLVEQQPVTTFSVDVDTASYSKIRQVIAENGVLPNPNAVRVEEMVNYFNYAYAGPTDNQPFAASFAAAECPWNSNYKLLRIALQAKKIESKDRPLSNIVFLLDVSGSMSDANKLPLVKKAIQMLVRQLGENDRVAVVVYAGAAGCVLPSTSAINQGKIMDALDRLSAGGSTNGAQGIQLAYQIARENFITGGVNRIILCTDGDFNVGTTSDEELVELVVQNAKSQNVFLTCLGFGQGNMNDAMMEKITNRGNGIYSMVDTEIEARRIMVEQINATLVTVAKDVKIQVEFNPQKIAAYRQIGYEDRKLDNRDFNDDSKDAGEIGAGHRVTALYEIVPAGVALPQTPPQDEPLRYSVAKGDAQEKPAEKQMFGKIAELKQEVASELLTVKLRYKKPEENVSTKLEFPLTQDAYAKPVDQDFKWASAVAQFGMLLRRSKYASNLSWSAVQEQAAAAAGNDESRLEAVDLIRRAKDLSAGYPK